MTISDERLADARARFIGAKLRVDDEGMVEVPLDYLDEAILAFEEVQQSRTTADTEQDGKGEMTPEEIRLENLKQMAAYSGPIVSFECREPYYLASCDKCGWVGSTELCGTDSFGDDSDVYCPRCFASGADCGKVAEALSTLSNAPQQEAVPVAWRYSTGDGWDFTDDRARAYREYDARNLVEPLYTSPPPVDPAPSQGGVVTETQETIGLWADEVFGKVTDLPRAVRRAEEEMVELLEEASGDANPGRMAKEMADVVIVLMRIAHVIGIDLAATINAKMAINRGRKWRADGTGHGYHIKDDALEAALNKGGE